MRRFLYLTAYFAPQTQVGALRPIKFARHLPAFGWQPVVLCDLWPSDAINLDLERVVPPETEVIADFSALAAPAWATRKQRAAAAQHKPKRPGQEIDLRRLLPGPLKALDNPELLLLSNHGLDMPHAFHAALRVLDSHPDLEAIVVNADPYAACLVGAALHVETGLPLIQDLRDPWGPCQLRRPRRPAPLRWANDALERWSLGHAAKVILNTETTRRDYLHLYPELDPNRLVVQRNHCDAELISGGNHPGFDRFTLLFLGRFTRYNRPIALLRALAMLAADGVTPADLQLVVTGAVPAQDLDVARDLGVEGFFARAPFVPYREIGGILRAADVLVAMTQPGVTQRMAAKFFDYVAIDRPILLVSDNPESAEVLANAGGGVQLGHDDHGAIAAQIRTWMAGGRQQSVQRDTAGLTSREAAGRLAGWLSEVTAAAEEPSKRNISL
jgi:glycosyltransferase involved in cell wall biosynthesis